MKLYTFTISEGQREGKLLSYAKRMLPQVPEFALREAFQKRDVKVNGQRVGMGAPVVPGAEVRIFARETEKKIPVLYEDARVLVVVKPAGISCEKDAVGAHAYAGVACAAFANKSNHSGTAFVPSAG